MNSRSIEPDLESQAIARFMMKFAKAVIIGPLPNQATEIAVNTASVTLVELGCGPMIITCQHVVDEALKPTQDGQSKIFQVGDAVIDLQNQLLDQSVNLDIATIQLHKDQLPLVFADSPESGIGSSLFRPVSWPPNPPIEGDVVSFGGFPGTFRNIQSFDEITFGPFVNTAALVASSSERHFISAFERDYWLRVSGNAGHLTVKVLGGMSGGPVFMFRDSRCDLIGIVKEYQDSYDSMCFASLKWVQPNGRISQVA